MRLRLLLGAAVTVASATANADSQRIVVLDFDGPRELAATGRDSVLAMIDERYEIIPTERWTSARDQALGHGPEQWQRAAKRCHLDAVIDGWIRADGDRRTLTVAVHDAATGEELDTFSVELRDDGIARTDGRKLATWFVRALTAMHPPHEPDDAPAKVVAVATAPRQVTPIRLEISTGAFLAARGMQFRKSSSELGPEYPSSAVQGVAAAAAAYHTSGIGLSLAFEESVGAYLIDMANGRYSLDHVAYEGGAHFRHPFGHVAIDTGVDYGKTSYTTAVPATLQIPNVAYRYVDVRARIEAEVADNTVVGVGARYFYVLGAGRSVDRDLPARSGVRNSAGF